jgi:hypothetical protein
MARYVTIMTMKLGVTLPTCWQNEQGFILHEGLCSMILLKKCTNINSWNYVIGLSLNMQTVTPATNSSQWQIHSKLVAPVTYLQQIRSEDCFCKEVSLHHFEGRRMFRESDLCCVLTKIYCSLSYSDKACCSLMVKESRNRPGVAQRFPGGLGFQISWHSARESGEVVSLTHRPHLPPGMFLVLSFTRGWVDPKAMVRSEGNMSLKNPVTPTGIDAGTVRLVAQRLNHYATPGPAIV